MPHVYISLDRKVNVVNHLKYELKLQAIRFVCTVPAIRSPTEHLWEHMRVTQASQGDLLGFVSSCHEKEEDHRDTMIFFTDYRDIKFKLSTHRLDSDNRNTIL